MQPAEAVFPIPPAHLSCGSVAEDAARWAQAELISRQEGAEPERHVRAAQPDTGVVHAGTEHRRVDKLRVRQVLLVPLVGGSEVKLRSNSALQRNLNTCCCGKAK